MISSPAKMYNSPNKMKDLSGDGKITKKDVLIGRGVIKKDDSPAKQTTTTRKEIKAARKAYRAGERTKDQKKAIIQEEKAMRKDYRAGKKESRNKKNSI